MKRLTFPSTPTLLLCGLSNGDLAILSISGAYLTLLTHLKLAHDFGLNSLDAHKVDEEGTHFCLVTGGDDQQLGVYLISSGGAVVARKKAYAHSSSVKGVCLRRAGEGFVIGTSSYDQRYKEWGLRINEEGVELKLKKVTRHCMSDMNGIAKVKSGEDKYHTVLVGQGLAIF
jgi:WD40 repeat protein